MLTLQALFGKYLKHKDATSEMKDRGVVFVGVVNKLMAVMMADGVKFHVNPITGSIVSGETLGGFRPKDCPIGAEKSSHKNAEGVDLYDPLGEIDAWLQAHASSLRPYGLYFEHPKATPRWSHWTVRAPKSKRLFFYP